MTPETVLTVGSHALQLALLLAAPLLLTALAVGVLIGVFQAATQINEQTLTVVPKMVAIMSALLFFGNWMLGQIVSYTIKIFNTIPNLPG